MASKNIFDLGSITVPLAGTEVIPIWNGTTTTKVTVANLTAGRDVSVATLNITGASVPANGWYLPSANALALSTNSGEVFRVSANRCIQIGSYSPTALAPVWIYTNTSGGGSNDAGIWIRQDGTDPIQMWAGPGGNIRVTIASDGTLTLDDNNIVFNSAAKGINFTANTPAAGMTSQLLNWYEEGTWTPALFASTSGTITSGSTAGLYIRTGKQVTVTGYIDVASVSSPVGSLLLTGLPFAASSGLGNRSAATIHATGLAAAATTSIVGRIVSSESQIRIDKFSAGSVSALAGDVSSTTVFHFSATYFV